MLEETNCCQDRDLGAWSQLSPHFSAVLHIRAPGKSCLDILHFVLSSFTFHPCSGSYQGLLLIPVATSLFPACLTSQPHLTQMVLPFSVTQPLLFCVSPLLSPFWANCLVSCSPFLLSPAFLSCNSLLLVLFSTLSSEGPHPGLCLNDGLCAPWPSNPAPDWASPLFQMHTPTCLLENSSWTSSCHLKPSELTIKLDFPSHTCLSPHLFHLSKQH